MTEIPRIEQDQEQQQHVRDGAAGGLARLARGPGRFWSFLVRNRLALAIASLFWLIVRSGSQPRRLVYPCQQMAVFNVFAFLGAFLPALYLADKNRCRKTMPAAVLIRRQLLVGLLVFVAVFTGFETYQFAAEVMPTTAALPEVPERLNPPQPTVVSIVHSDVVPVPTNNIESMVQEAVALAGGLGQLINPGDQVVLKLNLVMSGFYPGDGITTHPAVVRAVVRLCREAGAGEVVLADGTGGGDGGRSVTRYAFRDAGYDANMDMIDDQTGARLVDLNDTGGLGVFDPNKVTQVYIDNGVIRTSYWVPNIILNCDVLISLPLIKNHWNTGMTCALKNRIGCAPSDLYSGGGAQSKQGIAHNVNLGWPRQVSGNYPVPPATSEGNLICHYTVVDLNLVRPNDFVVVDGLIGNTDGPIGDDQPNPYMGFIMAGRDSVAVDSVACYTMGYDPHYIRHIAWANQRELGTSDSASIILRGDGVAAVRQDFPLNFGEVGITTRAESIPPTLQSVSITNGYRVTEPVTINVYGQDDGPQGVVSAQMFVDGQYVDTRLAGTQPFTFHWDPDTVSPGRHDLKFTVYDAAFNEASIVRQVNVNDPYAPGDFDFDQDVDMEDFGHALGCMTLTGESVRSECADANFNMDGDVDVADLNVVRDCISGPNVAADPLCRTGAVGY